MVRAGVADCRHWVFDLDGTLTVAVHDFPMIKRQLGIAPHEDILVHLAALPANEAAAKHRWLWDHELALAQASRPALGAIALLQVLHAAGCRLGILTRNAHALARCSLEAMGVAELFAPEEIIGRDELAPKPDPAGLHWFAQRWQVAPAQMRMVGDARFDLDCGRAAGVPTVLLHPDGNLWPAQADWHLPDCQALLSHWRQREALAAGVCG